jgi:hypothetical protein
MESILTIDAFQGKMGIATPFVTTWTMGKKTHVLLVLAQVEEMTIACVDPVFHVTHA